jgi:TP901 family phage tail tape measure protein
VPDFVIKTTFKGADKLSPVLKRMGVRVDQVGDRASRAFRNATRNAGVFGGVVKGILAAGILRRSFMAASMAVRTLGEEFLEFDKNITKAVTRLPGGLDRTSSAFQELGKIARREAARTEFTAGQTAAAVEQLALAGFNLEQSMAALPGTINLATTAGVEVEQATTIAAKTLGAFGLKVKDTTQLQKNLTRVNDVFARTVSSATLDIEGLFETLKFGGPAAFAAGQSIETFAASTGVLADASIDASVAGTSLRRAFLNLAAPTPKMTKQLRKLKVTVDDGKGGFRDFFDILADVEKGMEGYGNRQRLAALKTIFGARAVNAMNVLLEKGIPNLRAFRQNLEDSAGASEKMAKTIRQSVQVRLLRLKSALIEVGFKFLETFSDKAGESIDAAIEAVSKFDVKPVVQGLKDTIKTTRELIDVVKPFLRWLPELIQLWLSYRAALIAVAAVQAVVFYIKLAAAISAAGKAQGFLNIMMLANPIGLIVIGITALIFAIILVVKYFDELRDSAEIFITNTVIGFDRLSLTIRKGMEVAVNAAVAGINWLIQQINKIPGVELPQLERRDYTTDLKNDIKARIRLRDELVRDAAGVGVQRGVAGVRGARLPSAKEKEAAAKVKLASEKALAERLRTFGVGAGITLPTPTQQLTLPTGEAAAPTLDIPEQKVSLKLAFENAPPGLELKETKGTGAKPVDVKGLGPNR